MHSAMYSWREFLRAQGGRITVQLAGSGLELHKGSGPFWDWDKLVCIDIKMMVSKRAIKDSHHPTDRPIVNFRQQAE